MTRDEIEADRLERLLARDKDYAHDDPGWRDRFKPGSFGCHEALHTASILQAAVEEHLVDHPAVLLDSECFALASRAAAALADLYQAIGRLYGRNAKRLAPLDRQGRVARPFGHGSVVKGEIGVAQAV